MKDFCLIFACLVFPNKHVLFCNNMKNKLFKNIKTARSWANTICFVWISNPPEWRAKAWPGWWGLQSCGWWGRWVSHVPSGDFQTEEPTQSCPFQETKSTAMRYVARELTKQERQRHILKLSSKAEIQAHSFIHPLRIHFGPTLCWESGTCEQRQSRTAWERLTAHGLLGCGSAFMASGSPRRIARLGPYSVGQKQHHCSGASFPLGPLHQAPTQAVSACFQVW